MSFLAQLGQGRIRPRGRYSLCAGLVLHTVPFGDRVAAADSPGASSRSLGNTHPPPCSGGARGVCTLRQHELHAQPTLLRDFVAQEIENTSCFCLFL